MDEPLCRVEINQQGTDFVAKVYSDYEGVREFRSRSLDHLLRELTIDLEFSFGESVRRETPETPPSFEEEGVYPGEEML